MFHNLKMLRLALHPFCLNNHNSHNDIKTSEELTTPLLADLKTCNTNNYFPYQKNVLTLNQQLTKVNFFSPYMPALFREGLKVSI